jgi:hypothetical protein
MGYLDETPQDELGMVRKELRLAYRAMDRMRARLRELDPSPPRSLKTTKPSAWCDKCGVGEGKHDEDCNVVAPPENVPGWHFVAIPVGDEMVYRPCRLQGCGHDSGNIPATT